MAPPDNIYDKIQELLGHIQGNLTILEQQIDADVQTEYYNYARTLDNEFDANEILRNRDTLYEVDLALAEKKHMLVQLASIDHIEAYRTLEQYISRSPEQLKEWATLAFQECRLLMESRLLDQSQVLISTGLGGKGLKLRYFTVFISAHGKAYSVFEQNILNKESRFFIHQAKGEVEYVKFDKELCTVLSIIPLQVPVQGLFDEVVAECNQYGSFLNPDFLITNVKVLSFAQIRRIVRQSREK
jgi:hypothetical protein